MTTDELRKFDNTYAAGATSALTQVLDIIERRKKLADKGRRAARKKGDGLSETAYGGEMDAAIDIKAEVLELKKLVSKGIAPDHERKENHGAVYAKWGDSLTVHVDKSVDLNSLAPGKEPKCHPVKLSWACGGDGSIASAKEFATRLLAAIVYAEKLEE